LAVRPWLPDLFTNDARVIDETLAVLLLLGLMQPVAGVVFALDGILIGAGDMRFLAQAMVASLVTFLATVALVIAVDGGLVVLWLALIVFMVSRGATLLWRLSGDRWLSAGDDRQR